MGKKRKERTIIIRSQLQKAPHNPSQLKTRVGGGGGCFRRPGGGFSLLDLRRRIRGPQMQERGGEKKEINKKEGKKG